MKKKQELGETHAGLAKILLDRLSTDSESESAHWAYASNFKNKVSTPSRQMERPFHLALPPVDVSEISSAFSENTDTDVSQKRKENRIMLPAVKEKSPGPSHRREKFFTAKETSFLNPFEVTIDVSEESSSDIDSDDNYEPSFNVTLKPNNMFNLKEVTLEEQEFGEEECEIKVENESDEMKEDTGPGVTKLTNLEDIKILTEDFTCLVYRKCLLKLASTNVNKVCSVKGCNSAVTLHTENIGSALQHRTFNKKSGRWSVSPVKVDKSYEHIHLLQERIVEARLNDQQGMSHPVVLDADDPRRLGMTIAPTDPRPTAELQQEKISRFQIKT